MPDIRSLIFWVEVWAVIFSAVQVILATQNKISNYIFGIIGVLLSMYLLYSAGLYAECVLYFYYFVMSVYGYYQWKWGNHQKERPISKSRTTEWLIGLSIVLLSFALFYMALTHFTQSDVPIADALVSAFAWAGMWLMAKRKIENWIILNISNLINIPLLIHKELYLYAALTVFLFIMAVVGYLNWKKMMKVNVSTESKSI